MQVWKELLSDRSWSFCSRSGPENVRDIIYGYSIETFLITNLSYIFLKHKPTGYASPLFSRGAEIQSQVHVLYLRGKANTVADILSRQVFAVSSSILVLTYMSLLNNNCQVP